MANVKEIYEEFAGECQMLKSSNSSVICKIVGYNPIYDSLIVQTDEPVLKWSKFCDGDYINPNDIGGSYRYAHFHFGELVVNSFKPSTYMQPNQRQQMGYFKEVEKTKMFYRRKGL